MAESSGANRLAFAVLIIPAVAGSFLALAAFLLLRRERPARG